ncbi:MAG: hypothetical protein Q8S21_05220 [Candidatus Paracaedibacteraceae bacterium]|nr:hypothetical protein [Candidatus Paracaedibacteraceae bacterium]
MKLKHLIFSTFALFSLFAMFILEFTKKESPIKHIGTLSCFHENEAKDKKATCELSSATRLGNYIISSNDKDNNSVLFYTINSIKKNKYQRKIKPALKIQLPPECKIKKSESISIFKDWVISFGSYDRNTDVLFTKIIAFKFNEKEEKASDFQVVAGPELYNTFKKLLNTSSTTPIDYFKIEGSAIVPNPNNPSQSILLLGIREEGKSYKNGENQAATKIITVSIFEKDGKVIFGNDWKLAYNRVHTKDFGISSLEYNPQDKHLYVLLAHEKNEAFSSKLLKIRIPALFSNQELHVVDETSFKAHKAEGVAYLGNNEYFIVADDDRAKTFLPYEKRNVDESPYWIISPKEK